MGLGGHCVMWKQLHLAAFAQTPVMLVWALWLSGAASLCLFSLAFLLKIGLHKQRVKAEWEDAGRSQFFNAPNLAAMLLAKASPPSLERVGVLQAIWVIAACWQLTLTLLFYHRWMYDGDRSMDSASTPYLLSVVGWFILAVLGSPDCARVDELTGVSLTHFVFGVGSFFAIITYITLFQTFDRGHTAAGAPALFLVIAPIAIASIALAQVGGNQYDGGGSGGPSVREFRGDFGGPSQALLGIAVFLLLVLVRVGPTILAQPNVFGAVRCSVVVFACCTHRPDRPALINMQLSRWDSTGRMCFLSLRWQRLQS